MSALSGNLNTVDLANIFQMLSLNQREGTLYIRSATGTKALYFTQSGVQMLSQGRNSLGSLGRLLQRYELVTTTEIDKAVDLQRRGDTRFLGQILVETGVITAEDVERCLRIQVEEEIYSLFIWKDGEFEFVEGPPNAEIGTLSDAAKLTFNVSGLIMEAARRMDEWDFIRQVVTDLDEIYRYTDANPDLDDDCFKAAWSGKVLAAIDGSTSIQEIVDATYVHKFDACKVICVLSRSGAVEPVDTADLGKLLSDAVNRADVTDCSKFIGRLTSHGADTAEQHSKVARVMENARELESAARHYKQYAEAAASSGDAKGAFDAYLHVVGFLPTDLSGIDHMTEIFATTPSAFADHRSAVLEHGRTLADVYSELRHHDRAVRVLQRLTAVGPDDPDLRASLAQGYAASGMTADAVAEFKSLADEALQAGDRDRAERMLRNILGVEPGRRDVQAKLDRLQAGVEMRRSSARSKIVAAVVVVVIAAVGLVLFQKHREDQAAKEQAAKVCAGRLETLNQRFVPLTADLRDMQQRLFDARGDLERLPDAFARHRSERETWSERAREAVEAYDELAREFEDTEPGSAAETAAGQFRIQIDELDDLDGAVFDSLRGEAARHVSEARALTGREAPVREQLAAYRAALRFGELCDGWLETDDGAACKQFEQSLAVAVQAHETVTADITDLIGKGRHDEAFRRGIAYLSNYPPADLAAEFELPVRLESIPAGAGVARGGVDTGSVTPADIMIRPWQGAVFDLVRDGFEDTTVKIPACRERDPQKLKVALRRTWSAALQRMPAWSTEPLAAALAAPAAAAGDAVVMPTRSEVSVMVDRSTGRILRELRTDGLDGLKAAPLVVGGTLVLPALNGTVHVYAAADGAAQGSIPSRPPIEMDGIALPDGKVVVAVDRGRVAAVDPSQRIVVWLHPASDRMTAAAVACPPVLGTDGRIYVALVNGTVQVLNPATGEPTSEFRAPGVQPGESPLQWVAAAGDALFTATGDGLVARLDRGGAEVWTAKVGGGLAAPPLVHGGRVILVVATGSVVTLSVDGGREEGRYELGADVVAPAAMDRGVLFVGDAAGVLTALDLAGGTPKPLWLYRVPSADGSPQAITTRPLISDGFVFFGAQDRVLRAVPR